MLEYFRRSARISRYADVPFVATLGRMVLGRLLFDRGPKEFDTFRFATKPVGQWRTYLSDAERRAMQSAVSPPSARAMEESKLLFWQRCVANALPCAPIAGVIPNERTPVDLSAVPSLPVFPSTTALSAWFELVGDFEGFAKPIGGGQGYGAFPFLVRDGALVPSARHADGSQMFRECASSRFPGGGYLLQPRLSPHDTLRPLMPGPGLGTIRVYSFLTTDDQVEFRFAGLRVPAKGATCDNFTYGALGVPVDTTTGILGVAVGMTPDVPISHDIAFHPESGALFSGYQLPYWPQVISTVRTAALVFRELPALGWDVAICADGPVLIETNWAFSTEFAERLTNRGWADDLRASFARCRRWEVSGDV
jgi:hypothetical protein